MENAQLVRWIPGEPKDEHKDFLFTVENLEDDGKRQLFHCPSFVIKVNPQLKIVAYMHEPVLSKIKT